MHKHIYTFAALAARFPKDKVKVLSKNGQSFEYVTARTVMNRLDDVLGPAGWWDDYELLNDGSILCRLTIELPDGSTVTKCDVGGISKMRDESDSEKSGASDALKRAAVKFGVGRYLYKDGIPVTTLDALKKLRDGSVQIECEASPSTPARQLAAPGMSRPRHPAPRTGVELLDRVKEYDRLNKADLLARLVEWSKGRNFPPRFRDWSAEQVDAAVAEVKEMIESAGEAAQLAAC